MDGVDLVDEVEGEGCSGGAQVFFQSQDFVFGYVFPFPTWG